MTTPRQDASILQFIALAVIALGGFLVYLTWQQTQSLNLSLGCTNVNTFTQMGVLMCYTMTVGLTAVGLRILWVSNKNFRHSPKSLPRVNRRLFRTRA